MRSSSSARREAWRQHRREEAHPSRPRNGAAATRLDRGARAELWRLDGPTLIDDVSYPRLSGSAGILSTHCGPRTPRLRSSQPRPSSTREREMLQKITKTQRLGQRGPVFRARRDRGVSGADDEDWQRQGASVYPSVRGRFAVGAAHPGRARQAWGSWRPAALLQISAVSPPARRDAYGGVRGFLHAARTRKASR